MNSFPERLRRLIAETEPRLRAIAETAAGAAPPDPNGWAMTQELGHLVDSAINNRVRFIKAALEGEFDGPTYDGPGWVKLGAYATMPWHAVIDLWRGLNQSLASVLDGLPEERLAAPCRVGGRDAVSLEFLIDDYLRHLEHHLRHIFSVAHPAR